MVLGFARWAVKQALKDKTKTITIKPGTKFPGQKTVKEHKRDVSHKKYIDAIRNEGDKHEKRFRNKTLQIQIPLQSWEEKRWLC